MPQNTLLAPPHTDLRIQVHDLIYQGDAAFTVHVYVAELDQPLRTVSVQRYSGVGVDLLSEAVKAIMDAWLYQDDRGVKRVADKAGREARRHAETHEADRAV